MSLFDEKLDQWSQWYTVNRDNQRDLVMECKFLKRAMDAQLYLLSLARIEIKKAAGQHSENLWLPVGFDAKGSLKHFG